MAHYEYAELALRVSTDENDTDNVDADGDLLADTPIKSSLAWAFAYNYPVHRISVDYLPDARSEQPTYLALYRRSDDKVRFLELNAVTAALLDAVTENELGLSGEALLRELDDSAGFSAFPAGA